MAIRLEAERRSHLSKGGIKQLRKTGRLPAIVYGNKLDNEMIHISATAFQKWLKTGDSGFIDLQINGEEGIPVLLEDFQRDPRTQELLHVDFKQVQKNEAVRTKVTVKFTGTPAGASAGGVVQVQSPVIEVEALPQHLPSAVEHDISDLQIGDTVHVKDVTLPPEVTVLSGENEVLMSVIKP